MADFANTSESTFSLVPEATWGETPTSPTFQRLRLTGETLEKSIENIQSEEIRPDADVTDLIQTGASATGALNFELSYGPEFDTLFEHALRGSFASSRLDAGTEKKSFTFEKIIEVGSPDYYLRFAGCRVGTLSLTMAAQQIITGSVNITGKGGSVETSELSGTTYDSANTNPVMGAPDVANITIGNVSGTIYLTNLSLNINNALRVQNAIGHLDAVGIGYGLREVTGELTAYFDGVSAKLYEDFIDGAAASLSFEMSDGANTYTVTLPNVKYQTGRVVNEGNNQDVFAAMTFQALYDSVEGTSIYMEN